MHLYKAYINITCICIWICIWICICICICKWILVSSHHAMSYNAMTWTACVRVCLYVCVRVWHDSWRKNAWMHDSISCKPAECNEPLIYWLLPIQGNVLSCPVTSCQVLDSIHDMHARLQGKRPVQASRIEMADMAGHACTSCTVKACGWMVCFVLWRSCEWDVSDCRAAGERTSTHF